MPCSSRKRGRQPRIGGGAANAERATAQQRMAKKPRLYEDKAGNVKSRRAKTVEKKGKASSPEVKLSSRPEDRYGVRRRAPARGKTKFCLKLSKTIFTMHK